MSLWTQLDEELVSRGTSGLSMNRARSALKALGSVFGHGYVFANNDVQKAEVVEVPGDTVPWIVFGRWEDETCDIIREDGMFPSDVMIGWKRGQSRSEYNKELAKENLEDAEPDPGPVTGGQATAKGPRAGLSVVAGGRVRGSKRQPGREARNNARRKANGTDQGLPAKDTGRRAAAESVVQRRPGPGTDS